MHWGVSADGTWTRRPSNRRHSARPVYKTMLPTQRLPAHRDKVTMLLCGPTACSLDACHIVWPLPAHNQS